MGYTIQLIFFSNCSDSRQNLYFFLPLNFKFTFDCNLRQKMEMKGLFKKLNPIFTKNGVKQKQKKKKIYGNSETEMLNFL